MEEMRNGRPVLLWDATKTGNPKYPASGMKQVANRLRTEVEALGYQILPIRWCNKTRTFMEGITPIPRGSTTPLVSPEVYCEDERKGILEWLDYHGGAKAAIFYDAIPRKHPEITWPQSVYRHPDYMKMLGTHFTKVLSISQSSQEELLDYWKGIGLTSCPQTQTLQLGSDLHYQLRTNPPAKAASPAPPWNLLIVGILEPRKNHTLALEACEKLHSEGVPLHLHIAGRLNPHFGKPILQRIRKAQSRGVPVTWHKSPKPPALLKLYQDADLSLFPSFAEGCGLPVLESLWMGTPVLASNIPSVQENSNLPGIQIFQLEGEAPLYLPLKALLQNPNSLENLRDGCHQANLPTWRESAESLVGNIP